MIYICGDTHGSLDIKKLNSKNFPEQKVLTKNDYVIICGDFGLVWNNNGEDYWWRKWLDERNFTTLFIDGNHENFDLLDSFPKIEKFGGAVHQISDSIFHLCRGQVFEIDELKFFAMGGADSVDKGTRTPFIDWWPQEMPSYIDYENALYNLEQNNWKVDYVITHCAPSTIHQAINSNYKPNVLNIFFDQLIYELSFKEWFFGHYHKDFKVRLDFKGFNCVYNNIIPIKEGEKEGAVQITE